MSSSAGGPPPEPSAEYTYVSLGWRTGAWIAAGVFVAASLVGFARNVPGSLTTVGVALLLAFALDPLVVKVRRLGVSRGVAVAIVGAGALAFALFVVAVLGPRAVRQAGDFGRELPATVAGLYDLPLIGGPLERADAVTKVEQWVDELPARISEASLRKAVERLIGGLASVLTVLMVGLCVLVDGDRLVTLLRKAIPDRLEPSAVRAGRIFYRSLGAYFSGSLLVAACAATFILTVGLALGVPLTPAAALWALAVNLIPQVGGFLTGSFFGVLGFSQSPVTGLVCIGLYLVWMNFENHILQPAVVGQAVNLSPPTTMLAALIGGAAAGIPGALVATPLCGAVKAMYHEVRYGTAQVADARPSLLARLRRRARPPGTATA